MKSCRLENSSELVGWGRAAHNNIHTPIKGKERRRKRSLSEHSREASMHQGRRPLSPPGSEAFSLCGETESYHTECLLYMDPACSIYVALTGCRPRATSCIIEVNLLSPHSTACVQRQEEAQRGAETHSVMNSWHAVRPKFRLLSTLWVGYSLG